MPVIIVLGYSLLAFSKVKPELVLRGGGGIYGSRRYVVGLASIRLECDGRSLKKICVGVRIIPIKRQVATLIFRLSQT